MFEKCIDFGHKEKHLTSDCEDAYIQEIFDQYKIVIQESCFEKGALNQFHLRIWINSNSLTEQQAALIEYAQKAQYHYTMTAPIAPLNDGDAFCYELVTQYLKRFSVNCNVVDEVYLYLYDFDVFLTEYAYGHAIKEIKSRLSNQYGLNQNDIFVINEPIVKILVWEKDLFVSLKSQYSAIVQACYEELQKYDSYHRIQPEAVDVRILLSSELDRESLNRVLLRRE